MVESDKKVTNTLEPQGPGCSEFGVVKESLEETVLWAMKNGYLEMFTQYPDVKAFLATPKGQTLIKKYVAVEKNITLKPSLEHQHKGSKFTSVMNKAAFYLLTALTLQGVVSCKNRNNEAEKIMKINGVGTYSEALEQIMLVTDDDIEKEKLLYKDAFLSFDKALTEIHKLGLLTGEDVNFNRFLPLMIKESLLNCTAVSKNGAIGYFQLQPDAITDVNKILAKVSDVEYAPQTNPVHNIMYGVIYFFHTMQQLKDKYPDIQDMDDFVYASYNAGLSKITSLIEASDANSRDDLVKYIVRHMGLSGRSVDIKDDKYCPKDGDRTVRNFFGKANYSEDNTQVFGTGRNDIFFLKKKARETIRYVEIINAIRRAIDKQQEKLKAYAMIKINKGTTLFTTLMEMKKQKDIQVKDGTNMRTLCTDIAMDNNMNPDHLSEGAVLVITEDMMEQFDYQDTNPYKYDVAAYNKSTSYFLGKIVKEKIKDKSFDKHIIQKVDQLKSLEDPQDKEFYLMNSLIAFNTQNRKGWSVTTSKDVWIPSDDTYYNKFFDKSEKEVEDIENNAALDIKNDYINSAFEKIGSELTYLGNFKESDMLAIEKSFEHVVSRIQSKRKEKLNNPIGIVLHSTAGNIGDIPGVKAHFFVSKKGVITKLTDNGGDFRRLNHAGHGITGSGAIWSGDKDITYKSLGIEVEALGGEKRNAIQYEAVKKLVSYLGRKYKIQKKDVLAHSQVAFSSVGRGRKQDPYYVNRSKLGLPNNYMEIDKDVAMGKSPNMTQFIKELKDKGFTNSEIKDYLSGIDAGITIANNRKAKKMSPQDRSAWLSSSEILKNY